MEIQSEIERNTEEERPNESKTFNPLSPTSSPNHEFSFTISLHPQSKGQGRNKSSPSFDLSPADKIFFHGHLLPQHYLSNLPVFPRYSTDDSFDSFTLPIDGFSGENNSSSNTHTDQEYISIDHINPSTCQESCNCVLQEEGVQVRRKPRSFSILKWRKRCDEKKHDKGGQETDQKQQRNLKFNLSNVVKRYTRFINPFLSLRNRRMNPQFHGQTYSSFSGDLRLRNNKELSRGRRGEFSAPASMRNSPTNSGLLVASGTPTPSARDSTMEELQAAIQSAIAHCKKSIAAEETILVK
ncbi:BRI1 kinase inhibitor 1-like [Primulina huaijiensis]|uniref:BRI1 kinase inhibitor 1-like n=1 Tax=Primulina huaijiensis TaxID=1492673 RepID=UPI003CC704A4